MLQWINVRKKWLVGVAILMIIISIILFWFWQRAQRAEEQYQKAVVLQQEQLEQTEALSKALHISETNSKELQVAYEVLKHMPPAASFTVQAPSLEVATEQVAERIIKEDTTLPLAVIEKTDRTVVVKDDKAYKVDVLKINLDKSWEVSAGYGNHQGDGYIPVGVQKNYASNKAIAVEVHLEPSELTKEKIKTSGWEVRHVWRF